MPTGRLEVRLDREHRRKLVQVAAERGAPISDVVRAMIDDAYQDVLRQRRHDAARIIASMAIEDVPDPEELSWQFEAAHESTGLP